MKNITDYSGDFLVTDHSINVGLRAGSDRLVARFAQEPFALVFSGQGFDWLTTLKTAVNQGASRTVAPLVEQANELIAPVVDQIAGTRTVGFDPIGWASDAKEISFDATQAAISVPGIFVSQLAVLDVLESQGLDVGFSPAKTSPARPKCSPSPSLLAPPSPARPA